MTKKRRRLTVAISLLGVYGLAFSSSKGFAGIKDTGEKGAQIYCFMRDSGNDHEVSWNAAYEVIKRQANSLFKTSPKHGAVMIIEAVVDAPEEYQSCGNYLGDLFNKKNIDLENNDSEKEEAKNTNRYSY